MKKFNLVLIVFLLIVFAGNYNYAQLKPEETPTPVFAPNPTPTYPYPSISISANGTSFGPGDVLKISLVVEADRKVDVYIAGYFDGKIYWFPFGWEYLYFKPTPLVFGVSISWGDIAVIPVTFLRPRGDCTFYAAMTEHDTHDVIELDSVTITIK